MKRDRVFLLSAIIAYNLVFNFLSLKRHWSLNSSYLDLGLEAQAVWNTAHGRFFETSFGPQGQTLSALSYHLTPIILLLSPLYLFWPRPESLLVAQTLVLSLGAIPIFLLGKKYLDSRILTWVFVVSYFFYPPLEYSNLFDFHYVTLATTFLLFAFYFLDQKKGLAFYLFLTLAVSTKENLALVAALFGVYLFWFLRQRKRGGVLFLIFVSYFLVSTFYLMPKLGGGFGALGRYSTLIGVPVKAFLSLLNLDKIKYLFHLLVSVGFLPLLAPGALLLASLELLLNLLSDYNPQWQVKFHYTAAITPFVFISAIYGAKRLKELTDSMLPGLKHLNILISLYILSLAFLWNVLHSPSPLFYKFDWSKYQETSETVAARQFLKTIPAGASVSAMNNLGPHLSNRRFLYRFPIKALVADYVVVDPSVVGPNFDLAQVTTKDFRDYQNQIIASHLYEKVFENPRLLAFRRLKPNNP